MYHPNDPNNRVNPIMPMPSFPINPYNPYNAYNSNNSSSSFNPISYLNKSSGRIKDSIYTLQNDFSEKYNENRDNDFNSRHPNSKGDVFDKMNNHLTKGLYAVDNFGTGCLGHGIATAGRVTRSNYEINYERSPFTDKFERAYDAYDKATNIGI